MASNVGNQASYQPPTKAEIAAERTRYLRNAAMEFALRRSGLADDPADLIACAALIEDYLTNGAGKRKAKR